MDTTRFPQLLKAIYDAVDELESMFPGRHFTPDGHLVGSLGEALASHHYGVELFEASARCHDGVCESRQVQVKATQGAEKYERPLQRPVRHGGKSERTHAEPPFFV